jgi:hypothetical protein
MSREDIRQCSINALHDWSRYGFGGPVPIYQPSSNQPNQSIERSGTSFKETSYPYLKLRLPQSWIELKRDFSVLASQGPPLAPALQRELSPIDRIVIELLAIDPQKRPDTTKLLKHPLWRKQVDPKYLISTDKYTSSPELSASLKRLRPKLSTVQLTLCQEILNALPFHSKSRDVQNSTLCLAHKLTDKFIQQYSSYSSGYKMVDHTSGKTTKCVPISLLGGVLIWIGIKLVWRYPPTIEKFMERCCLSSVSLSEFFETEKAVCQELAWRLHSL